MRYGQFKYKRKIGTLVNFLKKWAKLGKTLKYWMGLLRSRLILLIENKCMIHEKKFNFHTYPKNRIRCENVDVKNYVPPFNIYIYIYILLKCEIKQRNKSKT